MKTLATGRAPVGLALLSMAMALLVPSCASWLFPEAVVAQGVAPGEKVQFVHTVQRKPATVSNRHRVYVERLVTGESDRYCVFNAEHVSDLTVEWISENRLEIAFDWAHIEEFDNLWTAEDYDQTHDFVEVFLKWKDESSVEGWLRPAWLRRRSSSQ